MNIILNKDGGLSINDSPLQGKEQDLSNLAAFISDPQDGDAIVYNASKGCWVAGSVGGSSSIEGLTDVDISSPTNGQTLVYNSTSEKWENGAGGGGSGSVLVVHIDEETGTLDKTWKEIHDAGFAVLMGDEYLICVGIGIEEGDYWVNFWTFGLLNPIILTTDSENGYPARSQEVDNSSL